ncbi:SAV_2336 N-terminal domain-related protein [Streptomyces sp. NPDC050803]|uniref:SAV_2336 N-terminal domain-related protein n=1 Tax=unclassified Streptomyces TaxID=2593676 RepID=UPI003426C29A
MNPDFDHILSALEDIGVEPTAREAAEALWLATHIARSGSTGAPQAARPQAPGKAEPGPAHRAPRPANPAARATLHVPTGGAATTATGPSSTRAVTVRVADAAALPHELNILRALRPLKRQVPSRDRVLLDETATAERSAEERLFLPATRPEPERWLSLALVMETGPTMSVWHSLVAELMALLQRTGAFRDIRLWYLHPTPDGSAGLHPRANPTSALHSPREILDPTGRQAIWCLSDCVSALWHDGRADRLLDLWSRRGPLAVIQPLPQRLWRRTGLRLEQVRLHTGMPGLPNTRLRTARPDGPALLRVPVPGTPVPVLELDASWLTRWTHLVTATAPGGVPAVVTMTSSTPATTGAADPGTTSADTPTDDPLSLVRAFRAHASPQAYRLAGCLATVPLTLPVMRLVQRVMLPESRPAHLAELLLSGLLHQDPAGAAYHFVDGVGEVLRSTVRHSDTRRVYDEVSAYLTAHAGDTRDTPALAVLPSGLGNVTLTGPSTPFAEIPLRDSAPVSPSRPAREPSPSAAPVPTRTWVKGNPERVRQSLILRTVDALQESPTMMHGSSRHLFADMLQDELGVPVEPHRGEPVRVWLLNVVRTCAAQPDGLSCLVRSLSYVEQASLVVEALRLLVDEWDAAEFFDFADLEPLRPALELVRPERLAALARRASRSRIQELPPWCDTGWRVFLRLAGEVSASGELPPSLAFVALCTDQLVAEGRADATAVLRGFNRSQAQELGLEQLLAQSVYAGSPPSAPSLVPAYLVIEIEPDAIEEDRYYLSRWRQSDSEGWHPVRGETLHLHREELPRAVERLVEATEQIWADLRQPLVLEFVLPVELLNEPVEWWLKESDTSTPIPLAMDYSVVVRSLERQRRAAWHRPWRNKWRQLKERPTESYAYWSGMRPNDSNSFHLERHLKEDPGAVCLILSEPPTVPSGTGRRELLAGLRAGVPAMIWHRSDCADPMFQDAVGEILQDRELGSLVERFGKWRKEALTLGPEGWDRHVGRHITLLLDDPDRIPAPTVT